MLLSFKYAEYELKPKNLESVFSVFVDGFVLGRNPNNLLRVLYPMLSSVSISISSINNLSSVTELTFIEDLRCISIKI